LHDYGIGNGPGEIIVHFWFHVRTGGKRLQVQSYKMIEHPQKMRSSSRLNRRATERVGSVAHDEAALAELDAEKTLEAAMEIDKVMLKTV
jgi:hypothetical protein